MKPAGLTRGGSVMKFARIVTLGLITLASAALPCPAQWGWPPPGYMTTGVSFCDGSIYRGLCARWRERRCGCANQAAQTVVMPEGVAAPPAAVEPPVGELPQPPR